MKHSIIPLFIPHYGCPHQCIFCNQIRITGHTTPVTAREAAETIERYRGTGSGDRYWEAAFYGGSFTALPLPVMESLLRPAWQALQENRIQGIRLSTRPDCINGPVLTLLKRMGVSTVELGVQSLDEEVLRQAGRGHTAQDAAEAVRQLREAGFHVGLQFMIGLPGETDASLRSTARRGAALHPDFVRLYPVLVLRGTRLQQMYEAGEYRPLTVQEAVLRCAFLKRWYGAHEIPVIRMGLQATAELDGGEGLLAGPYHAAFGELVDQAIVFHNLYRALFPLRHPVEIICHPADRSKVMGQHRKSWERLCRQFGLQRCREQSSVEPGTAVVKMEAGDVPVMLYREIK